MTQYDTISHNRHDRRDGSSVICHAYALLVSTCHIYARHTFLWTNCIDTSISQPQAVQPHVLLFPNGNHSSEIRNADPQCLPPRSKAQKKSPSIFKHYCSVFFPLGTLCEVQCNGFPPNSFKTCADIKK